MYVFNKIIFFPVKGRECNTHDDCAAIERSSCVKDPDDLKLRCLCGDDTPPNNGLCADVLKGKKVSVYIKFFIYDKIM